MATMPLLLLVVILIRNICSIYFLCDKSPQLDVSHSAPCDLSTNCERALVARRDVSVLFWLGSQRRGHAHTYNTHKT